MILVGQERNVDTPKEIVDLVSAHGGRNVYGEPQYRLVWGWQRKEWKYVGSNNPNEKPGIRFVPKYPLRERFHLECWFPAEHYGSREKWHKDTTQVIDGQEVETIGPYPSRGEYESVWVCEYPDGRYLQPTKDILTRAINLHKQSRQQRAYEKEVARRLADSVEDAATKTETRNVMRELTKEFLDKALPGRTVQQLKEELSAPKAPRKRRKTK